MASTSSSTTTGTTTEKTAGETARDVADTVIGAANEAASRLPEAASTAQIALADAGRTIRSGSDESLSAGTLVSVGFALGLLVGGAPRLLVLLALIPAAAMGLTLLDRQTGTTKPGTSATANR
ncbi:MAG TPA: hypothetical protein VD763_04130 [Candidatus Saccharimonadales bacterium]|nr:hypothetical protein [Candidatus Saccharimonadales bacterium]